MVKTSKQRKAVKQDNEPDKVDGFYNLGHRSSDLSISFEEAMDVISRGDLETIKKSLGPVNRMIVNR